MPRLAAHVFLVSDPPRDRIKRCLPVVSVRHIDRDSDHRFRVQKTTPLSGNAACKGDPPNETARRVYPNEKETVHGT